jgi:hypothetical protein
MVLGPTSAISKQHASGVGEEASRSLQYREPGKSFTGVEKVYYDYLAGLAYLRRLEESDSPNEAFTNSWHSHLAIPGLFAERYSGQIPITVGEVNKLFFTDSVRAILHSDLHSTRSRPSFATGQSSSEGNLQQECWFILSPYNHHSPWYSIFGASHCSLPHLLI